MSDMNRVAEASRIAASGAVTDPAIILGQIQPFRISTMTELLLSRKIFMQASGLQVGEFAENSWGFPFIPKPQPDLASVTPRLVPKHINPEYVAHPIFWIDPRLTEMTAEEQRDPVRWNIRMFYLLIGFGLLDGDSLKWFNGPESKDVSYNEADVKNYLGGFPSALDRVRFTEADLLIPLPDVMSAVGRALDRVSQMKERERERITMMQRTAVTDANSLLQSDPTWEDLIVRINKQAYAISSAAQARGAISTYVDETYRLRDEILGYLGNIDSISLILAVPVLQDVAFTTSAYSKVVSLATKFQENVTEGKYRVALDQVMDRLLTGGGFASDSEGDTVFGQVVTDLRAKALATLTLNLENFGRREGGEQVYASQTQRDILASINAR